MIDLPRRDERRGGEDRGRASTQVKRVRVGRHDGKVRVVIDGAAPGALAGAQLVPAAGRPRDRLRRRRARRSAAATPAPAAAEPSAAPAAGAQVLGVQFDAPGRRTSAS